MTTLNFWTSSVRSGYISGTVLGVLKTAFRIGLNDVHLRFILWFNDFKMMNENFDHLALIGHFKIPVSGYKTLKKRSPPTKIKRRRGLLRTQNKHR